MKNNVRSGIWTHALFRRPELESGALDHSAILTFVSVDDDMLIVIYVLNLQLMQNVKRIQFSWKLINLSVWEL